MKTWITALFSLAIAGGGFAGPALGLQTWTCRNLTFEETVAFAARHGLTRVQLFAKHLDPAAPPEVNRAKRELLARHGLTAYALYAAAGRSEEEDRKLFELARDFGMEFLVVEPKDPSVWDRLARQAREWGVRLAVHNHDKETPYGDPAVVRALLARTGDHVGVCLDVGWVTAAGYDAAEVFRSYGNRVFDIHFKDKRVRHLEGRKELTDTLPGEGDVNFDGLFAAIAETGWSGTLAIETDSPEFAADPAGLVGRSKVFVEQAVAKPGGKR